VIKNEQRNLAIDSCQIKTPADSFTDFPKAFWYYKLGRRNDF